MSVPLSDTRLTEIRERARRMIADHVTYASVQYAEDYGVLLAEVDRLHAELADGSCPDDCPCRQIPLTARWDGEVSYPSPDGIEDAETVICCVAEGGQPVAVLLDDERREALGLQLLLPDGDGEVDPQHLELARENERLRAELATAHAQVTAIEEHARRKADRGVVVDPNILLMILADHATPTV